MSDMTNANEKWLTKIGNLLRQAEGTDNPHEADAFTEAAQRLATANAIDLELARAAAGRRDKVPSPIVRSIQIGEQGKRGLRTYVQLFMQIARANDVKCDVASNSTYVVAYGDEADIDMTEQLYSSLSVQMVRACTSYLSAGDWKSQWADHQVRRRTAFGMQYLAERRPLTKITARLNFQDEFANRIGARLTTARAAAADEAQEAGADTAAAGTSVALVLKAKEVRIKDFYDEKTRARGTWRGNRRVDAYSGAARRAGATAAEQATVGGESTALGGARRGLSA